MNLRTEADFNHYEALRFRLENRAADPASGSKGQIYWNTVSHTVRVFDGSAWTGLTGSGSTPVADSGLSQTAYACPSGLTVNEAVYLAGADQVGRADANNASAVPAIGLVASKPTTTTCIVRYAGEQGGFSGLTPGATYFLSETAGQIAASPPTATGSVIQEVGFARNATTLMVEVDRDYTEL